MDPVIPHYPDMAAKVAVVTGGFRGIGAATCRLLAASGARVGVNGRDATAITTVVDGIRSSGGQALGIAANVTDFAAIERMRQQVEHEFGPVDVLIAFAGGHGEPLSLEQITEEHWRFVLDANLTATFLTVKSFLPGMLARRKGSIVTMASTAGRLPGGAFMAYAVAKAGIAMLTRYLAREVAPHGVRVNCVAPGAVRTDRLRRMPEAVQQQVAALHPLGRLGAPEDVALATLFLASDSSSWITGVTVDVAGGRVML